jgi:uncharacterized membrane protein (DUF106 family)
MNMKRGGSLDNSTSVLMIIVVLNLIAYLSVKDWMASAVLVLAGIASCTFENKGMVLFVGILAAALSRSVLIEGLTIDKKEMKELKELKEMKEKSKKEVEGSMENKKGNATSIQGSSLEGLSQQAGELSKRQNDLFAMAKDLKPMMKQAENMMNQLPKGFLAEAMKNFNKSKE